MLLGRKAETVKQHNSEPAAAPRGDAWSADDLHILWELLGNGPYTNVYHPNFAVKFSTFVEDYTFRDDGCATVEFEPYLNYYRPGRCSI